MPIMLRVEELEPGMVLACSVMNEFSVLLAHGRKLNEFDIRALGRKLPEIMVQVVDPVLDEMVDFEDDSHDREVSLEVRRNISTVTKKVSQQVRMGVALDADNVAGMQKVIEEMMAYLQDNPVTMAVIEQSGGWSDYLQEHSANVFYLSLVIGNTLRNYVKQERERLSAARKLSNALNLTPLATAAMFHDIGMVPLEHLYDKEGPLSEEERALVRAHPTQGAAMLPEEIDPMVRLVIRQHHENMDQTGYPDQLPGDKINIFARIIRVADAYAAAISSKVYQNAKSPIPVLYEMLFGKYRSFYDPVVLKVFASITQPLPIGAKLKLDTGKWAVVVKHNRENPFKPMVMVAFDEWGDPLGRDELEEPFPLGERADIKVKSFGDEDISFLNTLEEQPGDIELAEVEQGLDTLLEFCYP
ncbi:MAG: HD domain-containing protein [Sedimentisphaerales bacterium]|nr:HD domain-containing protein [Sedimentisphaerales bacterium]